jgi:hypothetical protein
MATTTESYFNMPQSNIDAVIQDAASMDKVIKNQGSSVPWDNLPDPIFFPGITLDSQRWNQLFPYRLVVIDSKTNQVINGSYSAYGDTAGSRITVSKLQSQPGGSTIVTFEPPNLDWVVTLPISPQQLNIVDQFSINTSATLRGILEEHNGVKFKLITAAGTMGVWPYRESVSKPPTNSSSLQTLFAGTLGAADTFTQQAKGVVQAATTGHLASKPTSFSINDSKAGDTSTGYYQALFLQQFLEQYAEAKKDPANASWRLVFDIPKQNQSFVVTPIQFAWQQNVNKPLEITYSLQFKAWRRVDLKAENQQSTQLLPYTLTPNTLQKIIGTITQLRRTCSSIYNLIGAVRGDVDNIFNILNQTSLFIKDLAGLPIALSDLPKQIKQDFNSVTQNFMSLNKASIISAISVSGAAGAASNIAALNAVSLASQTREGLSQQAVLGGQLGAGSASYQKIDQTNDLYKNPDKYSVLLDQVPINSLVLTTAQQNRVNQVVQNARNNTLQQLKYYTNTILELSLQLSDHFGAGSSVYNKVYGKSSPKTRVQPMSLDEFNVLKYAYDLLESYYILTATTQLKDLQIQNSLDYVAGLASQSGISFNTPNAKVLVPVPYGLNMEQISMRYLGDPKRWIEIATLNDLKEPYIDESGFVLPLITNGINRQITVNFDSRLYLGQNVLISSSTQLPVARKIVGISKISESVALLILDGDANIENFTLSDGAKIQAYLAGTINSQQKIFVPSILASPDQTGINIVLPGITAKDPLTGLSKIDWLLQESGDVALDNFGNFKYSYGLTNIVQALRVKFGTMLNSFIIHPDFGLGVLPGTKISDILIQDIYNNINNMIKKDPRFKVVDALQIQQSGPTLSISLSISIPGQSGVFPVSFILNK